jgi:hypothetical protein
MSNEKTFVFRRKNKVIGEHETNGLVFKFRKSTTTEKAAFARSAPVLSGVIMTLLSSAIKQEKSDILDYKGEKIGEYDPSNQNIKADIPVKDYEEFIRYLVMLTDSVDNLVDENGTEVHWADLEQEEKEELLNQMGDKNLYEYILRIMIKTIMVENNITEKNVEDKKEEENKTDGEKSEE